MNGVPDFYNMQAKQTSSGVWYCSSLDITTDDLGATLELMDDAIEKASSIIAKHNKPDYFKMKKEK